MTKSVICNKKQRLFGVFYIPKNAKACVIFSHGILSGVSESQRFSFMKEMFHKHNIATGGVYFPGHGPRKREVCTINESVRTIEYFIDYVKKEYPHLPIFLLGVSFGSSLIPLINEEYMQYIQGIILFSFILDLAALGSFPFEEKHVRRWETYGFSRDKSFKILRDISKEAEKNYCQHILYDKLCHCVVPKIFIHGTHDRVTAVKDILSLVDDQTCLLVYSGKEGMHDLRGKSLLYATQHCVHWMENKIKNDEE